MAISWTLNDGVLTISGSGEWYGYYGSDTPPWYENRDSITSAIIQNGITNIGNRAFYKCTALTSVTIPSSVTNINGSVFDTCTALTNITIPDSVTSIGVSAFYNCSSLTSITIPNSVTSIGSSAFNECRTLTSITIPNKVTNIDDRVFYNCRALTNVTILNRMTNIGEYAFYGCRVLTDIYYIGNETNWNSITIGANNDPLLNATKHYNYSPIVASGYCGGIDDGTNLSWMLTENGILTISGTGVMDIYTSNNHAPWFENRNSITSIIMENDVTSIGDYAFYSCINLISITISNNVTSIGDSAFQSCASLENITIPDSVTSIDDYVFLYCTNLIAINVDVNNTSYSSVDGILFNKEKTTLIQYPAKNSRTNYIIPDSVTDIALYAFHRCTNLTNITISDSVTSIAPYAFNGCINLTAIDVDANNTSYSSIDGILFNKTKTRLIQYPSGNLHTDYTIPDSVTNINDYVFLNCTNLINVIIPNSVTSISHGAFFGCSALTNITIPDSVTSIGNRAFLGCDALTNVYYTGSEIEWNVITIDANNRALTNATIHYNYAPIVVSGYCGGEGDGTNLSWTLDDNGVLTINGTGTMKDFTSTENIPWFTNRESITSIIIEDGITSIGNYAF